MYTKIIDSGQYLEVYNYEKEPLPKRKSRKTRKTSPFTGTLRVRRWDNSNKTRQAFRRLVYTNVVGDYAPALLTLTFMQITSLRQAYQEFKLFFRRARKFGLIEKYIAVPEFQKRGAVHFHILVWGNIVNHVKTERSTRLIQNLWWFGYVDIIQTDGSFKLAGYLSKYMSKAMQNERLGGERAFSTSRNVLRPMSFKTPLQVDYVSQEFALDTVENPPLQTHTFSTEWLGQCTYKLYNKHGKTN